MRTKIESVVIVKAADLLSKKGTVVETGYTATLRFENPKKDKIISANKKSTVYKLVDEYLGEFAL